MSMSEMLQENGKLVKIQVKTLTGGGHSGKKTTWNDVKESLAIMNLFDITTRYDLTIAEKPDDKMVYKVYMDYDISIDKTIHRLINHEGRLFKILQVDNPMNFDEFTKLLVVEADFIE